MSDKDLNDFALLLVDQFVTRLEKIKKAPEDTRADFAAVCIYQDSLLSRSLEALEDFSDDTLDMLISKFTDISLSQSHDDYSKRFANITKGEA